MIDGVEAFHQADHGSGSGPARQHHRAHQQPLGTFAVHHEQIAHHVFRPRRHHLIKKRRDGVRHRIRAGLHQQRGHGGEHRKERQERGIGRAFGHAQAVVPIRPRGRQLEQLPQPDPIAFLEEMNAKVRGHSGTSIMRRAQRRLGRGACYSGSVLVEERGPSVARRAGSVTARSAGGKGPPRRNRPVASRGSGWWRKAKTSSLSFGLT